MCVRVFQGLLEIGCISLAVESLEMIQARYKSLLN
jgi:hypothetical protein